MKKTARIKKAQIVISKFKLISQHGNGFINSKGLFITSEIVSKYVQGITKPYENLQIFGEVANQLQQ
jgi:hypothetical protein